MANSKSSLEEAIKIAHSNSEKFSCVKLREEIVKTAEKTHDWMLENKQSYTGSASLLEGKPWWPNLTYTSDDILLETREMRLIDLVFEHGIFHFITSLSKAGLIQFKSDSEQSKIISKSSTKSVINHLLAHSRMDKTISLALFSEFYGYSDSVKNSTVRDRYIPTLCPLGIIDVYIKQGYSIGIGPVGKAFMEIIFFPIKSKMVINPE